MNEQQAKIDRLRQKLMSNRRVICTGNPDNPVTLASGFKKIFPQATFIHRSNGWDLTDQSSKAQAKIKELFSQHNTFINSSFIAPGVQTALLDLCNQSAKFCDVFNIGSTHEFDGFGELLYRESKLDLRNKSLQLNTYRFQTHHIIIGKIDRETGLNIETICNIVPWIMSQQFKIPLICIREGQEPW